MQDIKQSKIFWIFFAAVLAISLIFVFNSARDFQSEMDILLIPRNKVVALNADKIQNDTKKIIESLNFYDQILDSETLSTEFSLGRTASQRKGDWNRKIDVFKTKNSNVVSVFAYDSDQKQAEILSQKIARQISDTMSYYYNIRTELDIRIIDGPVSERKAGFFNILFWILSLSIAGISGFGAFLFFNSFQWSSKREVLHFNEKEFPIENTLIQEEDYQFPEKEELEIPEEIVLNQEEEETFPDMFPLEEFFPEEEKESVEMPEQKIQACPIKTSAAPSNLPIAEDSDLKFSTPEKKEEKTSQEEIMEILEKAKSLKESSIHEATPEEVKARLNRLLKGE